MTCPFFERDAALSISCEGIIPGTLHTTRFNTMAEKRKYQIEHCEKHRHMNCSLARALMKKYEEEP